MKTIINIVWCFVITGLASQVFANQCGTCDLSDGSYPVCCEEFEGWGWENGETCVSSQFCKDSGQKIDCGVDDDGVPICCDDFENEDSDEWGWKDGASCRDLSIANNEGLFECNETNVCPPASEIVCPSVIRKEDKDGGDEFTEISIPCGCEVTPNLGRNKRAYTKAGAGRAFLTSAMMETISITSRYKIGDGKTGDAFNAGATKQNWLMMRQCLSEWKELSADDFTASKRMNADKKLDVEVYQACREKFGDLWLFGHRYGYQGLENPLDKHVQEDVNKFLLGYYWTYHQIKNHQCDDVRFWVDLEAI